MADTALHVAYYLTALFYGSCGVLLLIRPSLIEKRLSVFFPVLCTFSYRRLGNALNLIGIGVGLFIVSLLLSRENFGGYFLALILSLLEVYLGVFYYYLEVDNRAQAVIHFILHLIIATFIISLLLDRFPDSIQALKEKSAALILFQ